MKKTLFMALIMLVITAGAYSLDNYLYAFNATVELEMLDYPTMQAARNGMREIQQNLINNKNMIVIKPSRNEKSVIGMAIDTFPSLGVPSVTMERNIQV